MHTTTVRAAALLLMAAVTATACSSDTAADDPMTLPNPATQPGAAMGLITLSTGRVQGDVVTPNVRRFLKIPYAKPPVADLRWKPPLKPDAWTDIRHEPELSKACSQNMSAGSAASINEDCLYLNVWAPDPIPTGAPVMVWIHGGGNFAGGTDDKVPMSDQLWFDGRVFAERHGIIVVTLNYRLGPLGFFAHSGLAAEGSITGNQGLLDQHMALQWVHDNIAAFGGNPGNVTIFGESAGSSDVCYHVASPMSRGLFHRAISQSGGCTAALGSVVDPAAAQAGLQRFSAALGCESAPDVLACLRAKPIDAIMLNAMQPNPMGSGAEMAFSFPVVVDGAFLPKAPRVIFDAGELNRVPYILGSNTNEGTLFLLGVAGPNDDASYQKELATRFGGFAPKVAALYTAEKYNGSYRDALAAAVGDSGLICGTHDSARRAAAAGSSVWMYNFNIPWAVGAGALGATHASEISHVFGVPYMADAQGQMVADQINTLWATFAKTGDPNHAGAPAMWPQLQPDANGSDLRLQLDAGWSVLRDFRKEECALWRTRYASE